MTVTVLAGDIGGTNARLALCEVDGARVRIDSMARYESGNYPGLTPIVREFLAAHGGVAKVAAHVDAACLAVAAPITGDEVVATNLPWVLRKRELADATGCVAVELINDFAAIGWGIPTLRPEQLRTLQAGDPLPGGAIAYLGAGTGLGQGYMVHAAGEYHVMPSEGGHGDFAPRNDTEIAILRHLWRRLGGRVSYERLLSGAGLVHIYRALVEALGRPEAAAVREEMARPGSDDAAVVSRHALEGTDPTCNEALDLFVSIYGAEAGNLALRVFARGGVYVAGGIAPRILSRIEQGGFLAAFAAKGRFSGIASIIPVHVITDTNVGLQGAAACAARAAARTPPASPST